MYDFTITLSKEQLEMIMKKADLKQLSPGALLQEIINKYTDLLHTINYEDMAKGYAEMAEINLELAK
ncbi:MAG: hypothetical protein IJD07_01535 [Clostridia bacterium]|nr:hypothetical protein [Clostridia bacterium]